MKTPPQTHAALFRSQIAKQSEGRSKITRGLIKYSKHISVCWSNAVWKLELPASAPLLWSSWRLRVSTARPEFAFLSPLAEAQIYIQEVIDINTNTGSCLSRMQCLTQRVVFFSDWTHCLLLTLGRQVGWELHTWRVTWGLACYLRPELHLVSLQ